MSQSTFFFDLEHEAYASQASNRGQQPVGLLGLSTINSLAVPLPGDIANITARDEYDPATAIAQILWFGSPECAVGNGVAFYNVPPPSQAGFNIDQCDFGLPDANDGNTVGQLGFAPASFAVNSAVNTCNGPNGESVELGSVALYPDCTRKINGNPAEANLYCPGTCDVEVWSLENDGYQKCINTPKFAAGEGVPAFAIQQRVTNCR